MGRIMSKKEEFNQLEISADYKTVSKNNDVPFSKYPRPQFKRDSFLNLNGRWDCGITVPYPLPSENSMDSSLTSSSSLSIIPDMT